MRHFKLSIETESYQPIHIFGVITFQHFESENKLEFINRQLFLDFLKRLICTDESQVPNCYASVGGNEIYRHSHHLKNGFLCLYAFTALLIESETMQNHPHYYDFTIRI